MKRHIHRNTLVAAAAFLLAALAPQAHAAPTVKFNGSRTSVTLSSELVSALSALSVAPSAVAPATLRRGVAFFPIPRGELDLANAKGEIIHTGGLRLTGGGTVVELTQFIIDTTGNAAILTGLVKVNDSVIGRVPLFNLALPSLTLPLPTARRLTIPGVGVTLTGAAAQALNTAFGVTAFTAGIPIGEAAVAAVGAARVGGNGHGQQ